MIKTINTIVHIADTHVRLYKRHAEYKQVFKKLYAALEQYRERDDVVIVMAGDLNHSKTDMSPEMVSLSSEFLKTLADIAPTIVIAGNHDLNLANPSRLDSISPIVENLNHPRLLYYKNSGIYTLGNVDFAVFSIVDGKECWPSVDDCKSSTKIALYHGPVHMAQTDSGYVVTERSVTADTFDGFDIVLLGDIHRQQILKPKNPIIAYPGSLIQQNHGETLREHGWLEWDVKKRKCQFNELENDFGYVTFKIMDGKFPDISNLPKNIRVRLFIRDMDAVAIKKFTALLRRKYNVTEISVNRYDSTLSTIGDKLFDHDIHEVEYQNKLIRQYIEEHSPSTSSEIIDKVCEINVSMNQKLADEDLPHNVIWKPLHLSFSNLFSYGEDNYIDFSTMDGMYGLFSPNATGKTSAFDSLCYALYDKSPRAFKGSHIMNNRKNDFHVELLFEIGQTKYTIIRKGQRRKNGEVKVDVEFMRHKPDGTYEYLNGEDRRATNAIIRSFVGDYEDFVLTNFSVQNQNSQFIDKGQSERKDLLNQFMGLTVFDKLYTLASDEIKEVSGILKRFNVDDFTKELNDIQSNLESIVEHEKHQYKNVATFKEKMESLTKELETLYEKKIPISGETINIEHATAQREILENQIRELPAKISDLVTEQSALSIELTNTKSILPNKDELLSNIEKYRRMVKEITKLKNNRNELNIHIEGLQTKIGWLETHEYDPDCKYCVSNRFFIDAQQSAEELKKLNSELELLNTDIDILKTEMKIYENSEKDYLAYQNIMNEIFDIEKKISKIEVQREKTRAELSAAESQLIKYDEQIARYNEQKAAIETNIELDKQIAELNDEKSTVQKNLDNAERLWQGIKNNIAVNRSKREDLLNKIKEAEDLESTYDAYETYMFAINRDGLPYQMIAKTIPSIQASVNMFLGQVVDFTIGLEVDGKNINCKIIYDDDRSWALELASGMEKFVTSLAIRVALMEVSSLPRSDFLVIDEGFGSLDSENLSSIFALFNALKDKFDFIVLISHLDVVRDVSDSLIEIKNNGGFSQVQYSE